MNILIVDQDPETLSQLAQILRKLLPQADICAYLHAEDYYAIAHKNSFELAFLAYPLHGWEPFSLEADLHKRYPLCNIILITQEVLLPSSVLNIYPSGALCKPFTSEAIQKELSHLRYPISDNAPFFGKLQVQTFGNFLVFDNSGNVLHFSLTRSKEILAFLIDQCGFSVTTRDIAAEIFEQSTPDTRLSKNISKYVSSLIRDLEKAGHPDVVIKQNRSLEINKNGVDCDLYRVLNGDPDAFAAYHGEYLIDYSWAEHSDSAYRLRELLQ